MRGFRVSYENKGELLTSWKNFFSGLYPLDFQKLYENGYASIGLILIPLAANVLGLFALKLKNPTMRLFFFAAQPVLFLWIVGFLPFLPVLVGKMFLPPYLDYENFESLAGLACSSVWFAVSVVCTVALWSTQRQEALRVHPISAET